MKTFLLVLIAFFALIQVSLCDCPSGWTKSGSYCKKAKNYQYTECFTIKIGEDNFKNAFNRCETQNKQGVTECERNSVYIFPKCAEGYTKSYEGILSKCAYKSVPTGYKYLTQYMDSGKETIRIQKN